MSNNKSWHIEEHPIKKELIIGIKNKFDAWDYIQIPFKDRSAIINELQKYLDVENKVVEKNLEYQVCEMIQIGMELDIPVSLTCNLRNDLKMWEIELQACQMEILSMFGCDLDMDKILTVQDIVNAIKKEQNEMQLNIVEFL